MSERARVSVVLANWNGVRFLGGAIESVVRQTFGDWVLIIVDTGSTDGSRAILNGWAAADRRIRPILMPRRLNCPAALNIGLSQAHGRFVARIESDDLWLPNRLEEQIAFLDRPSQARVGVCGADVLLIDESGRALGTKRYPRSHEACLRAMWYRNPFCHSSVLVRREVFQTCGGYDEASIPCEDLALWFRVGRIWELRNLPRPLASYRVWPGSLTSRKLRSLVWRSYRLRREAVRNLGYRRPPLAALYSASSLGANLLPPKLVRRLFQLLLSVLGEPDASAGLAPGLGANRRIGWPRFRGRSA